MAASFYILRPGIDMYICRVNARHVASAAGTVRTTSVVCIPELLVFAAVCPHDSPLTSVSSSPLEVECAS